MTDKNEKWTKEDITNETLNENNILLNMCNEKDNNLNKDSID